MLRASWTTTCKSKTPTRTADVLRRVSRLTFANVVLGRAAWCSNKRTVAEPLGGSLVAKKKAAAKKKKGGKKK